MEQRSIVIPSRWRYLLGALFAAGGIFGFVVLLISNISPDLRIVMPGTHLVEMDKGSYTLFYEYRSEINGQVFSSDVTVPGIRVAVISPDDAGVELTQPETNKNYEFDGRAGYSVLKFEIEEDAIYTVAGGFPEDTIGSDIVMAIGKTNSGSLLFAIISLVGGLLVALVLVISGFNGRGTASSRTTPVAMDVTSVGRTN